MTASAALVAALVAASLLSPGVAGAQEQPPDVVVIVTDDQRFDTLWAMPTVRDRLVDAGARFSNAFVVNALCCPSRASILTGDYSHTTGMWRQSPPFGRFEWFDDSSTLATWLDDAGYTTGLFGKYLDGYQHAALTGYVPPGWDRWVAFVHSAYYGYKLTVDGRVEEHGSAPGDYSTDVLVDRAVGFIRSTDGPLLLEFAPAAPHDPAIPAPGDEEAFADLPAWRPPAYDEEDASDKPAWVRGLPPITAERAAAIDAFRANQYRSLLAVDRGVGRIVSALEDTGRLENTLIVFTSDNGIAWGEHRWTKKEAAYEEVIRVPMVVRWDAGDVAPGSSLEDLALNIDIAPTIAEAVGFETPPVDGRSFLGLLDGSATAGWREDFLVEHLAGSNPIPTFCAVRTTEWKFVRYSDGEEELYALRSDPGELENLASDAASLGVLRDLRLRLDVLCEPRPPGYLDDGSDRRIWWAAGVLLALFVLAALRTRRSVTERLR
jgi:arylsulfatase A-like enzyme